ncbi:formate C-acetyltransferase domain protein [Enterobacter hormaechei subsp. xiangfangensis]|nr:formate C-acetyltransferase domain protein [Enterobacter hormaechei subsp. xiangfangensis]
MSEENKRVLHAICPWWRGQTVQDRCYGMFTDEQKGLLETGIIKAEGNMTSGDAPWRELPAGWRKVSTACAPKWPAPLTHQPDGLEDLHGDQFLKASISCLHIKPLPNWRGNGLPGASCWRWQKTARIAPSRQNLLASVTAVLLHSANPAN